MLTWKDFFDFDDSQPIDNAIKKIEQLEGVYQTMIGAVEDSNQRLAGDFSAVQENAEELLKTVSKLNIGMEANQKVLAESATQSEDLVKEYLALKEVQAANEKQIKSLTDQMNALAESKKKAKEDIKAEAGSLDDLRVRLAEAEKAYKAMGSATDQAVKDEQLERVRGLSAEYKAANGALTEAKKGATLAAGSYNELAARVAEAKKRLKEMEGGLDGNSKEFKELKKFAAEGTEQLKEWDSAVGDNQRNVGDYKGQIAELIPGFQGVAGSIDTATKAGMTFIATPIGAIIVAIAAALGALTAYFRGSIEGQDDFNKVLRVGEAILETLMDVVEEVGKVLFQAITKPKETWEQFMKLIKPLGDMLKWAFENPLEALKEFGKAIVDNVIKRFEAIGKAAKAINKIVTSGFTEGWQDLADAAIQAATGVENAIDKIANALKPITDEFKRRLELAERIAALENRLRKERIADILDDAKTELAVVQLLVEARDKLRFSDEQRFNKLRAANKLLEEQLEGDLDLIRAEIALQQMLIEQNGETYEERQKLVELQAQEIEMQTKFFQQRKKRQAEEIALIKEIEKEIIDSQKRIQDANRALETVRLNDTIKTNQKILDDVNSSMEDRIAALIEISTAQEDLLEQDRDRQLEIAKEAAMERVELSQETIDAIFNQENLSIEERIALKREAQEAELSTDQAYMTEVLKIMEDYSVKQNDIIKSTAKAAEENAFKVLARDAARFKSQIQTGIDEQIVALDEALARGEISVREYQRNREDILADGFKNQLNTQLDFLNEELKLAEGNAEKRIAIEEKIAAVRRQLADATAKEIIEIEQQITDAVNDLQGQVVAFATEAVNARIQKNIEGLEKQLSDEEEAKNRSIAIVGEDKQAKAAIEQNFANKQKEIERQIIAEKRKAAIFDKAVATTQAIVQTALGVSRAIGSAPPPANFILAALVAAAGALQVARIVATPIPQFFTGSQYTPEGLIRVGDRFGREIVVGPDGSAKLYEKDTIIEAERGSKVIPNYKTEQILAQANKEDVEWQDLIAKGYNSATERIGTPGDARVDVNGIISSVNDMKQELKQAIKEQPQDFYDEKGFRHYEHTVNGRINSLNKRYTLG